MCGARPTLYSALRFRQAFEARQVLVKMDDPDRWRKYLEARALPGLELSEITKPGGFLPSKVGGAP